MHVGAIVLEREAGLAARRKFVDEAGGGIGDVDDGLTVAGHSYRLFELAGAVAVRAPSVDVLEGRRRRFLSGDGLCGMGAGDEHQCGYQSGNKILKAHRQDASATTNGGAHWGLTAFAELRAPGFRGMS